MKISMELLLVGMVTAVACVVAIAVMFEQLWPVFVVCLAAHYVYRHYHPKGSMPRKVPTWWKEQQGR